MKRSLLLAFISAVLLTLALVGLEYVSYASDGLTENFAASVSTPVSSRHRNFSGMADKTKAYQHRALQNKRLMASLPMSAFGTDSAQHERGRSPGYNTGMLSSKEAMIIRRGGLGYNSPWNRHSTFDRQAGHSSPFFSDRISLKHISRNRSNHHFWSKKDTLAYPNWWSIYSKMPSLSQRDIDGVEKFVFFVGYPRSGHSIIGSMMDAHPNMIIPHEFMLFRRMTEDSFTAQLLQNKTVLFNALYQKSYRDANNGSRSPSRGFKGYTLYVGTPWQATFDGSLKVIGDKSGGQTVMAYGRDKFRFMKLFSSIRDTVQIPIRVIHVVRNPYDMIATGSLYKCTLNDTKFHKLYVDGELNESSLKGVYQYYISSVMQSYTRNLIELAWNTHALIQTFGLKVLEIHAADLAKDPRKTISRICTFLEIPCPEDYLQACYDKAYKTESKSRHLVAWPMDVQADVDEAVRSIPFFRRYSFEGD